MNLQISDLTFRYSRRQPEVLSDFSTEFRQGGICGLLGPNGVGKSTLLYLIAGALTPGAGYVSLQGIHTRLREPEILADIYLVPEEVTFPALSLTKYVALHSPFYPNFDRELLNHCLKEFCIDSSHLLDRLSMGQKKKIAISFAFACRTPVLLLDEPTNGLDIPAKAAFRSLISLIANDEQLTLISTHQVRDIDLLLDRVVIMNHQRIILNESIEEIQKHLTFQRGVYPSPSDALCVHNTPGGFDVMKIKETGDESEVNLELLYDYAQRPDSRLPEIMQDSRHTLADR